MRIAARVSLITVITATTCACVGDDAPPPEMTIAPTPTPTLEGAADDPASLDEPSAGVFRVTNLPLPPRPLADHAVVHPWTSGRPIAVHEDKLLVIDRDNRALIVMEREAGRVLRVEPLGTSPRELVVGPDGVAWITDQQDGTVTRIDPAGQRLARTVGAGPMGLALNSDATRLYVALNGEDAVLALDPHQLTELDRRDGIAGARAVATGPVFAEGVTHNQRERSPTAEGVLVTCQKDDHAVLLRWSEGQLVEGRRPPLREHNPHERLLSSVPRISDPTLSTAALHNPNMGGFLVAHQLAFPGDETTSPSDGNRSAISNVYYGPEFTDDARLHEPTLTPTYVDQVSPTDGPVLLGEEPIIFQAQLPSDLNHHPRVTVALMTSEASNSVLILNTSLTDPILLPVGLIRVGSAPRGVAFAPDGNTAYVLHGHDFTVGVIDMAPIVALTERHHGTRLDAPLEVGLARSWPFGEDPLPAEVRDGRRAYTEARFSGLSDDGNISCAMCHPEGLEDGVVWFTPNGPRQTPSLAGRLHDTAPFNWLGSTQTLEDNMAETVERLGGTGLSSTTLAALVTYLHTLPAPPNGHEPPDGRTAQQLRGMSLFHDPNVGCATCHSGAAWTDNNSYDVGTTTDFERRVNDDAPVRYNTPSLLGLHHTAPYLHDGSARTLRDVLSRTSTTMGHTAHLSSQERDDLIAFLMTL